MSARVNTAGSNGAAAPETANDHSEHISCEPLRNVCTGLEPSRPFAWTEHEPGGYRYSHRVAARLDAAGAPATEEVEYCWTCGEEFRLQQVSNDGDLMRAPEWTPDGYGVRCSYCGAGDDPAETWNAPPPGWF